MVELLPLFVLCLFFFVFFCFFLFFCFFVFLFLIGSSLVTDCFCSTALSRCTDVCGRGRR
jgi:hypothetical protein